MSEESSPADRHGPHGGGEFAVAATAFTYLTRLPLARFARHDSHALSVATRWFPAVGLLIGAALALALSAVAAVAPIAVAAIVTIVLGVVLTGGLHEDGLADVADSTGGFTVEKKLAIMRDSRIGTYGALALLLLVLARFTTLSELGFSGFAEVLAVLLAAHVLGRWCCVLVMAWQPSARAEGANRGAMEGVGRSQAVMASGVAAVCLVPTAMLGGSFLLLALPLAVLVAAVMGLWFRRSLGGVTGDCLGAIVVLVEIAVLFLGVSVL